MLAGTCTIVKIILEKIGLTRMRTVTMADVLMGSDCEGVSPWGVDAYVEQLPADARAILDAADAERGKLGDGTLRIEHLLLALYAAPGGHARRALHASGVTHGRLLEKLFSDLDRPSSRTARSRSAKPLLSRHLQECLGTACKHLRGTPLVLVVDDHPDNVEILQARLASRGYLVETALNGSDALAAVDWLPPDLILMDVLMRGLDGMEVTRMLRAHPRHRPTPVIMVTALGNTDDLVEGFSAGADDYIVKPFQFPELEARIRSLLTRRLSQPAIPETETALLHGAFSVVECSVVGSFAEAGFDVWTILQRLGCPPIPLPAEMGEVLLRTSRLSGSKMPSQLSENPSFYSVFISHSSEDGAFADRLHADLVANGVNCWHYRHDMQGGRFWRGQIHEAIKLYEKLIVVCSESSLLRANVIDEIISAVERERETGAQKLFPVRIDDFVLSAELLALADHKVSTGAWREDWVRHIRAFHIPDFREWQSAERYDREFRKLLDALTSPPERPHAPE